VPVHIAGFVVSFGSPDRLLDFTCDDTEAMAMTGVSDDDWPDVGYIFQTVPYERLDSFGSTQELREIVADWCAADGRIPDSGRSSTTGFRTARP
jgi:hypothetical protein